MTILLLSLTTAATGNATTAQRIRGYCEAAGHRVVHLSTEESWQPAALQAIVERECVSAAIGIHAFGAGKHMRHLSVPYAIVFGGTDINELSKDPQSCAVMSEAVHRATVAIAFDDVFIERAALLWPDAVTKLRRIPQAAVVHPSSFSLRRELGLQSADRLLLLPSGVRPVKDPLFCAPMITTWHTHNPRVHMVILGAARDERYAEYVRAELASMPGVRWHPAIPQHDLHAAMREADVVMNTSVSESCPNAVLEAMALGTPVVVRDIPGNRSIVTHGLSGLLFATPATCREQLEAVLDDRAFARMLAQHAQATIAATHNVVAEQAAYGEVIDLLLRAS